MWVLLQENCESNVCRGVKRNPANEKMFIRLQCRGQAQARCAGLTTATQPTKRHGRCSKSEELRSIGVPG